MKRTQIRLWRRAGVLGLSAALALAMAGCASPGPPRPPSLHLPEVVTDLTADRIGGRVVFHWTNPATTTDGQAIKDATTAVLCRMEPSPAAPVKKMEPCLPIQRLPAMPGAATAYDALDAAHIADPPRLLGYRLELFNAKNRSAGPSTTVWAAAGAAPQTVEGLRIRGRRRGLQVEWDAAKADAAPVRLRRTLLTDPSKTAPKPVAKEPAGLKLGKQERATEALLAVGTSDAGGMLDTGVKRLETYRYTAERVLTVTLAGHALELHSPLSAPVEYAVRDVFAPNPPAGLAVVPGFGDGAGVDLSWAPSSEEDLAGYLVYRSAGDGQPWMKLTAAPIEPTAFTDKTAATGTAYRYRITAVDQSGNEGKPGGEVRIGP